MLSDFTDTCFHICISASVHINHAAKVRELDGFLYLVTVYSDLVVPFTSSAHPFGLVCIDLKSNFTSVVV